MKSKLLLLFLSLFMVVGGVKADEWTNRASAPAAGQYVLYNEANKVFLKATSVTTSNYQDATVFTLSANSNFTIAYQDNGTKYVYESGGDASWGTTNNNKWNITKQNEGYYIYHRDPGYRWSNRSRYISTTEGGNGIHYPYQNFSNNNKDRTWYFIKAWTVTLLDKESSSSTTRTYYNGEQLPILQNLNSCSTFDGWYNDNGEKVTVASANESLTAKWNLTHEYENGVCKICGWAHKAHTYDDVAGVCDVCHLPHTGHTYDDVAGVCDVCHLAHEGHSYDESKPGVCKDCRLPHEGHSYDESKPGVCKDCYLPHEGHSYDESKPGVCKDCYLPHEGHSYDKNNPGVCKDCYLPHEGHSYNKNNPGVCKDCYLPHEGHSYNNVAGVCDVCYSAHEGHSYDENNPGVCEVCHLAHTNHTYVDGVCECHIKRTMNWVWTGEELVDGGHFYICNTSTKDFVIASSADTNPNLGKIEGAKEYVFTQNGEEYSIIGTDGVKFHNQDSYAIGGSKTGYTISKTVGIWIFSVTYYLKENNGNWASLDGNTGNNKWFLITPEQKKAYDAYVATWDAAHEFEEMYESQLPGELSIRLQNALSANVSYDATTDDKAGGKIQELIDALAACQFKLHVGSTGYATIYLRHASKVPGGVSVYTAEYKNSSNATLHQVVLGDDEQLPAETGFVVNASEGDYYFIYSKNEGVSAPANNLSGVLEDTQLPSGSTYYLLGNKNNTIGFYKWTSGTLGANKAYLDISTSLVKDFISFGFGDEDVDAINGVELGKDTDLYDVMGRKLNSVPTHGMYIKNGKKYMVK